MEERGGQVGCMLGELGEGEGGGGGGVDDGAGVGGGGEGEGGGRAEEEGPDRGGGGDWGVSWEVFVGWGTYSQLAGGEIRRAWLMRLYISGR